ncbi:hypothetical protein [Paenibacillus sp. YYML68]|uniref:hypothetical protein n=1 Tax=Paenibacillus sp. YYML68 TaxID=2909250 RepID=UPI002493B67F|nr:hypothetical protein [Paenibacillus sp. YYML68]
MFRVKLLKQMINLLVACTLLIPISALAKTHSNVSVTPKEAQQAAAWHVMNVMNGISNDELAWNKLGKDFKVNKAVEVYDPTGNHVAYFVNIANRNFSPSGFVLVSAFEDEEPILAWSEQGESINPEVHSSILKEKYTKIKQTHVMTPHP